MDKVNLAEKFALFNDYCRPKIAGELNGQMVKVVKQKGNSFGTSMTRKTNYSS